MGIIGLTSLIEVNPHLLSNIELRDTDLIVDGNSFCYQIYNASRIDSRFGGDYPKYEDVIRKFLDQFELCRIRPTFVFDGLLDVEKLKRDTALQRQKTRLQTAKLIVDLKSHAHLLPLIAHNVLVNVLIDRRVEIYQCAGEADGIAVGLANDRQAPLLSQDSDFFIFDLKCGYVPFDTVQWNHGQSANDQKWRYLRAKLYRVDNLLEHYPAVDRRLLPLFAFLCGNDFSAGHNLTKFFEHVHRPTVEIAGGHSASYRRGRSKKGDRPMRRHCNMVAVLEWLRDKTDEDRTIEEALTWIELKHRNKVQQAAKRSMEAYRRGEMKSSECTSARFEPASITKASISHLNLPEWFANDYVAAKIPAVLLHVRQDRRIFLPALVENFSKPSIYDCCQSLRLATYHILLKTESSEKRFVTEYSRDCGLFVKRLLSIDDNEEDGERVLSSLPNLADVEKLESKDHRRLFFHSFQFGPNDMEIISEFPQSLTLFVSSFLFWCQSEDTQVKRSQACALLICAIWLCSQEDARDDSRPPVFPSENDQLKNIELEYDYTPEISKKRGCSFAISNLHSFSQWQACFQASIWLESLLMHPFGSTVPMQRLYHGRVIYNLAVYLERAKSESAALDHIFKDTPRMRENFVNLWKLVEKYLPDKDATPVAVNSQDKNGGKKGRNNRKIALKVVASAVVELSSDKSGEDTSESSESDSDWGLENRFRMLCSLK